MFCIAALVVSIYHLSLCSCSRPLALFGSVSSDAWEALLDASHGRARGKTAVHAAHYQRWWSTASMYLPNRQVTVGVYGRLLTVLLQPARITWLKETAESYQWACFFGSPAMLTVKKHTTTVWWTVFVQPCSPFLTQVIQTISSSSSSAVAW